MTENSDSRKDFTKVINDHNSRILFNSIKNGAKVEIILPKYYG